MRALRSAIADPSLHVAAGVLVLWYLIGMLGGD